LKLLRELTKRPWLTKGLDSDPGPGADGIRGGSAAATGMWFYVGVASVMFSLIVAAYVLRLGNYGADPAAAAAATATLAWWTLAAICGIPPADDWAPMAEPFLLWINTGVLVLSSIAWQKARGDLREGRMDKLRITLTAGGLLALVFLAGQVAVWRTLIGSGQFATVGPALAFFYLITAMHGLHLLGGLFFWWRTTARVLNGARAEEIATGVNLCAVYWHYLLLVWIVMFGLLLIT